MRKRFRVVVCAFLVLAGAASGRAQQFTGGIRGAVKDANGVIPGVAVTLTNEATNISREVVTNQVGQSNFPAVAPGTYTVKSQSRGYKTFESKGITIGTQQFVTLDVTLEIGAIAENVTVTGQTPLIDTSNASTGGNLSRETLESLPAPGRNAFLVGVTVPTVMPVGDPQFNRQQDQTNASRVSLGGGGIRANNYLLDGVPISELRGRAVLNPTIEAVEEVKVQVHTYDADMGRTGGGVFNVTVRSGTNDYHGSGFYQTRPVWGQSENFFNAVAGVTKEESGLADAYYRLYGGGIGGPIVKNRTFFWTALEGYRSGTTRGQQEIWPTANQRNGDFSRTLSGGAPVVLYNPWCRSRHRQRALPRPRHRLDCDRRPVHQRDHPAHAPCGQPDRVEHPQDVADRDHYRSDGAERKRQPERHRDCLRRRSGADVDVQGRTQVQRQVVVERPLHLQQDRRARQHDHEGRQAVHGRPGSVVRAAAPPAARARAEQHERDQQHDGPHAAVRLQHVAGLVRQAGVLRRAFRRSASARRTSARSDRAAPIRSRRWPSTRPRTSAAGARARCAGRDRTRSTARDEADGAATASRSAATCGGWASRSATETDARRHVLLRQSFTSRNGTGGNEVASLLLGLPSTGSVPHDPADFEWYAKNYGAYFQDDWRVSSSFTLNYGLRLEHEDGLREINNSQTVAFDRDVVNPIDALVPKTGTLLAGKTLNGGLIFAGVNGADDHQGDPTAIKLAPRVGATYALIRRPWFAAATACSRRRGTTHDPSRPDRVHAETSRSPRLGAGTTCRSLLDNPFPSGLPAHRQHAEVC